jgi:hypothetical protein
MAFTIVLSNESGHIMILRIFLELNIRFNRSFRRGKKSAAHDFFKITDGGYKKLGK